MYGAGVSAGGGAGGGGGGVSPRATGWGNYRDTQYSAETPFQPTPDTLVTLPNNAGIKDETQLPEDLLTFYNPVTRRITGSDGSDIIITVRARLVPRGPATSTIKVHVDIGTDATPIIIESTSRAISWGVDVEQSLTLTFSGYCRETFEANGARIRLQTDGPLDIYGISYVIKRTHKGV